MLRQDNLAAHFCRLLASQRVKGKVIEWRIIGQEKDGSMLVTWVLEDFATRSRILCIGLFNFFEKSLRVLHQRTTCEEVTQATVNSTVTLLVYVVKTLIMGAVQCVYQAFVVEIKPQNMEVIPILQIPSQKQVMAQFLWKKPIILNGAHTDKFLLFIHEQSIMLYTLTLKEICEYNISDLSESGTWYFDGSILSTETIAKSFIWAQWDPDNQTLYYINLKSKSRDRLKDVLEDNGLITTLSALQFHDKLPTETVLSIPLNLPRIRNGFFNNENIYEDDSVPLRVHDTSLNLLILTEESGMLLVCHYYLYQPINPKNVDDDPNVSISSDEEVHFAYSVTILHHGCIVHCVMPGISPEEAKRMKPTFAMHDKHHVLVFQPDLFAHLLDIGPNHEPCCHIVCPAHNRYILTQLIPCRMWGMLAYDSATLDLVSLNIPKSHLIKSFRNDSSVANRLSIVHYFLLHSNDTGVLPELLNILMERPLILDTVALLKEVLVAGSYATTLKGLPADALHFARFLPFTTSAILKKPIQAKVANINVGISHESLWNTSNMLLSSQQRLSPYKVDFWTRLWEKLNEINQRDKNRFAPEEVAKKLMSSLACYESESLSRNSALLSPSGIFNGKSISDPSAVIRQNTSEGLPFIELESDTETKQDHVISVNMRELRVHLIKNCIQQSTGFRWLKDTRFERSQIAARVNITTSIYINAQLELSRTLCSLIFRTAGINTRTEVERGFQLINEMSNGEQYSLFLILERYCLAVASIAFPLPQSFSSFFTYLGYKAVTFEMFLQYVDNHVFELQIDVMETIINDVENNKSGVEKKLLLLCALPKSRSQRLLKVWNHPEGLLIRAREHAANILDGNAVKQRVFNGNNSALCTNSKTGIVIDKLSPLDSFLDLLTAKASLNELDFNLLIETTIASMEKLVNAKY